MPLRLHKVLAHAGVASRRAAEQMILAGRVRVNGAVVTELGTQVEPGEDVVEVDGEVVDLEPTRHEYVILNKPVGVVTTAHDPQGRPTVVDMVPSRHRLYPVGRLDRDSEGLVLLTDDGELTYRLTQARYGVEKEYHALVTCEVPDETLRKLKEGVELEDGLARAIGSRVIAKTARGTWVRVVLVEGRKRQVRRMLAALGCPVERLRRVRIGPIHLGELPPGKYKRLSEREAAALRRSVDLPSWVE